MEHREKASGHSPLRDCQCFNLRRATLAVTAFYDQHLKGANVTSQQFAVMRHIKLQGPLSVTELSERMGLDRTTLSRNLTLLERRGLLTTEPSRGRQRLMTLTSNGEETFAFAMTRWEHAQKELEDCLGVEQVEQLEKLLEKILNAHLTAE